MRNLLIAGAATFLTLAAAACGDDSSPPASDAATTTDAPEGTPDAAGAADAAAPDAVPADAAPLDPSLCPPTYGPATILDTFVMSGDATQADAFDLDGDLTGDNILNAVSGIANMGFNEDLMDGDFRALTELRMLDDPSLVNDPMLNLFVASGVDTDVPVNVADDFSHMEAFYFSQGSVLSDCTPVALMPAVLAAGKLTAQGDSLPFNVPGFGLLNIGEPRLETDIAPDPSGVGYQVTGGRLGGALPTCPLQNDASPVGNNTLHALTGIFMIQPDIDLDGDGLETIDANSLQIYGCYDGDGTLIMGDTCGCDPRIVDGFSIYITFTAVGASVSGPAPTP